MERPAKRLRIPDSEIQNPRDTGSRMTEGLFTSEIGILGDHADNDQAMTPTTNTMNLWNVQRRSAYAAEQQQGRPMIPRRNAGVNLLPRAPDATVTASVVEINVNDGTTTTVATEISAASTGTVVSLSDVGTVTLPGLSSATSVASSVPSDLSVSAPSGLSASALTTSPPTAAPSDTISLSSTVTDLSSTASVFSEAVNSTSSAFELSSTTDRTVTVTTTSTLEVSLINGTIVATGPTSLTTEVFTTRTPTGQYTVSSTSSGATALSTRPSSTSLGSTASSTSALPATSSDSFTSVGGAGVLAGSATSSTTASAPSTSSSNSDSGGGGPGLTPVQQQVVGGVVGGVAGVAVVLLILLVFLRWYRRRLKSRGQLPEQIAQRNLWGGKASRVYSRPQQPSSRVPFVATLTNGLRLLRPHSTHTMATTATGFTTSTVPESDRGFQRIAGRKIAPVLSAGGDGFGDNYGAFEKDSATDPYEPLTRSEHDLAGSSFYRDRDGFYSGKGGSSLTTSLSPTTATTGARSGGPEGVETRPSMWRDFADLDDPPNPSQFSLGTPSKPEGYAVMRPSPARTPVTLSPATSSIRLPIQQPPSMDEDAPPLPTTLNVPGQKDGVGRSLVSQDSSRVSGVSRSSGRSGTRFVENIG